MERIRQTEGLRIAAFHLQYFQDILQRAFPDAEVVTVDSYESFMARAGDEEADLDAMLTVAEIGSAWSLLYPEFGVVIPKPRILKLPLAYPVADDEMWGDFVSSWIDLKRDEGTIQEFYDHWILGLTAEPEKHRWSIIRDVLHWVD